MGAVLDVPDPRLPEKHQKIHAADGDLPETSSCLRVPEDALDPGALLELAPPGVAVDLLIVGLLQDGGKHAGEGAGGLLVPLFPGQHVGLGVVVHGVGVLVGDGVEEPPGRGLGLALHHVVFVALPVAHLEPLVVRHDPALQGGLARLVLLQDLSGLSHLGLSDDLFLRLLRLIGRPLQCGGSLAGCCTKRRGQCLGQRSGRLHLIGHPAPPGHSGQKRRLLSAVCHSQPPQIRKNLVLSLLRSRSSGSVSSGTSTVRRGGLMGCSISTYRHSS